MFDRRDEERREKERREMARRLENRRSFDFIGAFEKLSPAAQKIFGSAVNTSRAKLVALSGAPDPASLTDRALSEALHKAGYVVTPADIELAALIERKLSE